MNSKDFENTDLDLITSSDNWKAYTIKQDKNIKLNPGEVVCKLCRGWGYYLITYKLPLSPYANTCFRCKGTGKVDWITNIIR